MNAGVADRAALLVQHAVVPAAKEQYEEWITAVTLECQRFAGF